MTSKPQAEPLAGNPLSRREWLGANSLWLAGLAPLAQSRVVADSPAQPFFQRFCLNTGTIRGQNLSLTQEFETASKAGYQGIEPWLDKLRSAASGTTAIAELKQRLSDLSLTIEGAIGFSSWCVDDDSQRAKGFEEMKRDMALLAQLGGQRIAAPPAGVPQERRVEVSRLADRYHQLLELGRSMSVLPVLEFWGGNPTLGKLSTALAVAAECGHPRACVLADVFHMYRGGSPFEGLRLLSPASLPLLHLNDYPTEPLRDKIDDSHRVLPGDGIAPLVDILRTLRANGVNPVLSLEIFNREHWKEDALQLAQNGLQKMKAIVAAATS